MVLMDSSDIFSLKYQSPAGSPLSMPKGSNRLYDFQTDWSEVLNKNTEFTRFLIQHIIKPKKAVICLSIPDCFARLLSQEEKKKKVILSGYVHKAQIDGIKIYGIAHPAWLKINYGRQAEIGKCLLEDWDK